MPETATHTPQAFGSSGGKFHLAKKISSLMPEHKTYVEPYAGGAAVYFYKEPAEKEILNDMDKEIAFAYRFIRDMSPEEYERLKKKDWVISRSTFGRVKAMHPANDLDRFYKFYYMKKASFRTSVGNVNVGAIGKTVSLDRLPKVQARLRGVAINSVDAMKMIDKYDGKNTFFYLDPPYPETSPIAGYAGGFSKGDLAKLTDKLRHVKGKFLLSMDTTNAKLFPKWMNIKRVTTMGKDSEGQWIDRIEVLASNYKLKPRRVKRPSRARPIFREHPKSVTVSM